PVVVQPGDLGLHGAGEVLVRVVALPVVREEQVPLVRVAGGARAEVAGDRAPVVDPEQLVERRVPRVVQRRKAVAGPGLRGRAPSRSPRRPAPPPPPPPPPRAPPPRPPPFLPVFRLPPRPPLVLPSSAAAPLCCPFSLAPGRRAPPLYCRLLALVCPPFTV